MGNSHFKKHSAVFECRYCGRRTRDTTGDNGSVELCADCNEGSMQENGYSDSSSDPELKAQYERNMRECFQRAVNKGGTIEGYTAMTAPKQRAMIRGINTVKDAEAAARDLWAVWPDDYMCRMSEIDEAMTPPCARSDDYRMVEVRSYDESGMPEMWRKP